MLLRTKIFRQLVLFATIPSIILAVSAYFLLQTTIEQTSSWLAGNASDRTINALRLVESKLQTAAESTLSLSGNDETASGLDWQLREGAITWSAAGSHPDPMSIDSIVIRSCTETGPVRVVVDGAVLVGFSIIDAGKVTAGGYLLDESYLAGLEAATSSLSESRNFSNILPAFILFLFTSGGIILIIVISLAWWLSRRLSRSVTIPLEELLNAVIDVGRGRALSSLSKAGTEEVDNLAGSFRSMSQELELNRKKLVAAERVQAWQAFARVMAHELKNPLTPISLSLYRIKNKLQKTDKYGEFEDSIEAISAEVAHLERLASDYSSLAKLPEPRVQTFDVHKLIEEIVDLHKVQLEAFNFAFRYVGTESTITADPDRIREVIINVLKNALEFCIPGGRISLLAEFGEKTFSLTVSNSSQDVSETDFQKARIPYYTTRKGGSGLGLAVSDKIVIDHGGSMSLRIVDNNAVVAIEIPHNIRTGDDT